MINKLTNCNNDKQMAIDKIIAMKPRKIKLSYRELIDHEKKFGNKSLDKVVAK